MRVLVTGVNGQLGHDVLRTLHERGHEAVGSGSAGAYRGEDELGALPYAQLDITDAAAVDGLFAALRPDALIHCSAWTAVDAAEDAENREKVFALNETGPRNLARACETIGAKMLYLSTDYVFDGQGTRPWEPEDTNFSPLNVYGQSKLAGERAVAGNTDRFFIVRIAWVFGKNGKNFVRTMLKLGVTHESLRVVCDQVGTPTYTADLAPLLADMIETERYGVYHATNEGGWISWYDFACEIFRQAAMDVRVEPVTTEEYGASKAARPRNSRLDKEKLTREGFRRLPVWQDALARYLKETGER